MSRIKISSLTPMLWTTELKETIEFYTSILGFKCVEYNEEWGWAALSFDDIGLMIAIPNAHTEFIKPLFTGSFYFNVDDVDELWMELKDKVHVCYHLDDFEYGMRDFAIYDNNGYILQFGQAITDE